MALQFYGAGAVCPTRNLTFLQQTHRLRKPQQRPGRPLRQPGPGHTALPKAAPGRGGEESKEAGAGEDGVKKGRGPGGGALRALYHMGQRVQIDQESSRFPSQVLRGLDSFVSLESQQGLIEHRSGHDHSLTVIVNIQHWEDCSPWPETTPGWPTCKMNYMP